MFLHVFLAFPTGRLTHAGRTRAGGVGATPSRSGCSWSRSCWGSIPTASSASSTAPAIGTVVEGVQLSLVAGLSAAGRGARLYRRRPARVDPPAARDPGGRRVRLRPGHAGAALRGRPVRLAGLEIIRLITFAALGLAPIAFLFALLDLRLARGEVAALLVELRADPDRRSAGAPRPGAAGSVAAAVVLAARVRQLGRPGRRGRRLPRPRTSTAPYALLYRDGEPMAALTFDRSLEDEPELLDAVAGDRRHRARERPAARRAARPAAGAAGLPGPGARSRPAGTSAAGTGPARRRPGTAGRPLAGAGPAGRGAGGRPGAPSPAGARQGGGVRRR